MLFIMILNVLFLSMLFIAYRSYAQSQSCSPRNFISAFLAWFPHLHLILYAGVPKSLCLVALLTVSIFLEINSKTFMFLVDMYALI